jgi:two-component system LytT family sensor kinase
MEQRSATEPTPAPVSVHFVNNVLAAAASYVDDDPDQARDVLAELSAFLSYRLRTEPLDVPLAQELDHVAVYVRLQQARFPDRVEAVLPARGDAPDVRVRRSSVQDPVAQLLGRRLGEHPGPARLVLRMLPDGDALEAEVSEPGGGGLERLQIPVRLEVAPT